MPHEKLVHRLSQMLLKLNRGERLQPAMLAAEFGVDVRTVQRDLNERLSHVDLVRHDDGTYALDVRQLGRLNTADIERFAVLSGIAGLFPNLGQRFVQDLLSGQYAQALAIRGPQHENAAAFGPMFDAVRQAVERSLCITFDFTGRDGGNPQPFVVQPYRVLNQNGIWYLAAVHDGRLKHFTLGRVLGLHPTGDVFVPDEAIARRVQEDESLWSSDAPLRMVLTVSAWAAPFFTRRPLLPHQRTLQTEPHGALLLETTAGHADEVLPIVRYWIPHLRIVEPALLQHHLATQLTSYLAQGSETAA